MLSGVRLGRCCGGALALSLAACSGAQVVTLGDGSPRPYHFDSPIAVTELSSPDRTDNPTLTGDLLEIYFTSDRAGGGDLWVAARDAPTARFQPPTPIVELNTDVFETSAAISTDGLTLWFGSDRPGGVGGIDVWVSTRASRSAGWSAPGNVVALNSTADDIPRPLGLRGTVMPMASTRATVFTYHCYFASRAGRGAPFGTPAAIPELAFSDRSTVDAFLTDDGLTLFYSSAGTLGAADAGASGDGGIGQTSDLYVAWRRSMAEPFSFTQPLDDLNTPGDERDPWLTPDGSTLYFTSDRDGSLAIYTARVRPRL